MTVEQVVKAVLEMNAEELSAVATAHRTRHGELTARSLVAFKRGDVVEFFARRRWVRARVTGFNRKTLSAVEVSEFPVGRSGRWTVAPTLCRKVG